MTSIEVLLFDNFTMLDAFGPVEVLSRLEGGVEVRYVSRLGGAVAGSGNVKVSTERLEEDAEVDIFLVPGGMGTRTLVADEAMLATLRARSRRSQWVLSVCTGSALLAKAGVLDGRRATSNKRAWDWVIQQSSKVDWIRRARWVVDGKFYTSSGVTAGVDMALGFVRDQAGLELADQIARAVEHVWNPDSTSDPFSQ